MSVVRVYFYLVWVFFATVLQSINIEYRSALVAPHFAARTCISATPPVGQHSPGFSGALDIGLGVCWTQLAAVAPETELNLISDR